MILKSNFYDLRGSVTKLSKTQITSQLIFVSFRVDQPPCQQQLPVNVESHFHGHQIYLKMILKNYLQKVVACLVWWDKHRPLQPFVVV